MSASRNEFDLATQPSSTHHVDWATDDDHGSRSRNSWSLRHSDPPRNGHYPHVQNATASGRPLLNVFTSRRESGAAGQGAKSNEVVGWKDLPKKKQLFVITMARLSEPLVQTSLQSYMFYQLKWFDPTLSDATISSQAGILHASFTAAQFLTAMVWGRISDASWAGRKTVILIGLFGTCKSCSSKTI